MIGTTGLKDLRVDCIVGDYELERKQPQPIVMDIALDYDVAAYVKEIEKGKALLKKLESPG